MAATLTILIDGLTYASWLFIVALGLTLVFLAHQAWISADAIVRTLWRMGVSRRLLLEWQTASQVEQGTADSPAVEPPADPPTDPPALDPDGTDFTPKHYYYFSNTAATAAVGEEAAAAAAASTANNSSDSYLDSSASGNSYLNSGDGGQ